jgi:hypothetical protein
VVLMAVTVALKAKQKLGDILGRLLGNMAVLGKDRAC